MFKGTKKCLLGGEKHTSYFHNQDKGSNSLYQFFKLVLKVLSDHNPYQTTFSFLISAAIHNSVQPPNNLMIVAPFIIFFKRFSCDER